MITVYEFSTNFHVANEHQSIDIEGRLAKTEGENNGFEVAIEIVEFSPKEDNLFTADKTHTHSEEFDADTCEEAMDVFTSLLNTMAMPLLEWTREENLSDVTETKLVETKPDEELTN